ncbi:hypothetical protein HYS82_00140 [Candidatus Amesbacteria bacterium]|nr:hypothetical protein [Candidatus Amesbacteria bacterium]MBI2587462.1 hypothetical protein [Candidatus Amesbacteria bacterium]
MDDPVVPPQPSRAPVLLASVISGLVFLSLGFLLGRSFSIRKQPLTILETLPTSTPTLDLSSSWQTYAHPIFNYSFSYPPEAKLGVLEDGVIIRIDPADLRTVVGICPRYIKFFQLGQGFLAKTSKNNYSCVSKTINLEGKIGAASQYPESNPELNDQILSTFKFLK